METEVVFSPAARRDLRRLDRQVAERVAQGFRRYVETGHGDVVRLTAAGDLFRLRIGDWRVRFRVRIEERPASPPPSGQTQVRVVEVARILHRSAAYDDL
jgi:mRNA interferase RelE/StbE